MTSPILFAGQEDLSFTPIGSGFGTAAGAGLWVVNTSAGFFRSGYARYSLQGTSNASFFLRNASAFSASSFWTSGRAYAPSGANLATSTTGLPMRWVDSSGVVRLRLRYNGTGTMPTSLFVLEKITAAGVVTQLGSVSTDTFASTVAPTPADKIDVFINYAVSGQITVYRNLAQIFTFSGDVTTDGQTALAFADWGTFSWSTGGSNGVSGWSECIVATRDTRNMSLVTQAATALGNTDTFTGGAVANINLNRYTDVSPDFSAVAAQIQEYQITPAPPTGNFSVVSLVQHGRVTLGSSGPQHIDFMVRTGGADFVSSDLAPTSAWSLLTNNWDTNPNTSAAWQTSELPATSTSFNFGYKSVT